MAQLTKFGYQHQDTSVDKIDPRIKITCLALISITSIYAKPLALLTTSITVIAILNLSKIKILLFLKEMFYFYILLVLIILSRSLSVPGKILFHWSFVTISYEGIYEGLLIVWRLLLIAILGLLVTATTPQSKIRSTIEWFLKPFPCIPHHIIGTMIALLIRFIPVVFLKAREIATAQRSRAIERRKNPIYRIVSFAVPVLRGSIITADRLAMAMEARNYGYRRTTPNWRTHFKDYFVLIIGFSQAGMMLLW